MTTAIAYCRISTDEQADGLAAQRDACWAWCDRAGAELLAIHADEGVSGSTGLDKRPGLLEAIASLQKGAVLVVARRDRLGRDPIHVAMIESAVARKGARVVSAAGEGTDNDDPASILMRRMIDAFSEYERLIIKARTRAAMQGKKRRGEFTGGEPPFGWRLAADGTSIEPCPLEQPVLQTIEQMRADGLGTRAIAERLNAEGMPARGTRWHRTTIRRALERGTN